MKPKLKPDFIYALGEGNLIFCCTGSQENFLRSVGRQNNKKKNAKPQGRHIHK